MHTRFITRLICFCELLWALVSTFAVAEAVSKPGLAEFAGARRDATEALQKAFDRGGTVRIPSGVFLFSQPLRVTRSGTTIVGAPGSVLLLAPGKANDGLCIGPPPDKREAIGSVRDIRLVNLTVRNSRENYDWSRNTGAGIGLWGVFGARVENCRVDRFVHDGIAVRVCRDVLATGCDIHGGRHGIDLWGHYQGGKWGNRDIRINACRIAAPWDTGIAVGFFTSNVTISGCVIRDARCHGIDIFNVTNVVVSGNVIRDWLSNAFPQEKSGVRQAVGVFIHTDWGVKGALSIPTSEITITGNTLVHGPFPKNCRPVCIEITGTVSGVTVSGNTVKGGQMALAMNGLAVRKPAHPGGALPAPRDVVVADNVFRDQSNLFWIGGATPVISGLVANNVFSPAPDAGVHLAAGLRGLVITGNLFQGGRFQQAPPVGITWRGNFFGDNVQAPQAFRKP